MNFRRGIAEAALVALHCHQERRADPNKDWVGIDIVRFDRNGGIVEHRDVLQVVPGDSANGNSVFQRSARGAARGRAALP